MDLKIWKVSLNNGEWSSNHREYFIVSLTREEAIEKCFLDNPKINRDNYFAYATEFEMDGYVIEVFTKKDYIRLKNIEKIES
jgi:hypothetical protein